MRRSGNTCFIPIFDLPKIDVPKFDISRQFDVSASDFPARPREVMGIDFMVTATAANTER